MGRSRQEAFCCARFVVRATPWLLDCSPARFCLLIAMGGWLIAWSLSLWVMISHKIAGLSLIRCRVLRLKARSNYSVAQTSRAVVKGFNWGWQHRAQIQKRLEFSGGNRVNAPPIQSCLAWPFAVKHSESLDVFRATMPVLC